MPERIFPERQESHEEESWITNTLLFHSRDPGSDRDLKPFAQNFVDDASKNFGMKFVDTGAANRPRTTCAALASL